MSRISRRTATIAATAGAALALTAGTAATASASSDYSGGTYQVEISANTAGASFWFWSELGAGQTGNYQETDCIHLGGGHATDAAAHDAGDVSGWSISNGFLSITGVEIIGGLETATLSIPVPTGTLGHSSGMTLTVTSAVVPIIPVGAVLTLPSQNEIAP
jgi:hypothetical protein